MDTFNLQNEQEDSAFDQMLKRAEADSAQQGHSTEDELHNLADNPRALVEDFEESLTDNRPMQLLLTHIVIQNTRTKISKF